MKLRSTLLASTAVAASLIAAGCGDDDEPEPVTTVGATGATGNTGPLSKPEFIAAADAICAESEDSEVDQLQELFPEIADPGDLNAGELQDLADEVVVPSLQAQLDQIRALTPPEGDEEEINAITDRLEEGIAEIQDDPSALSSGAGPSLKEASALAQDYGFEECGS
ncbi:MAG: hypothetical protein M3383_08915 [Actinomycetota bacterium]|nr:hypothetical protein [Actinomycetota bacterium]